MCFLMPAYQSLTEKLHPQVAAQALIEKVGRRQMRSEVSRFLFGYKGMRPGGTAVNRFCKIHSLASPETPIHRSGNGSRLRTLCGGLFSLFCFS